MKLCQSDQVARKSSFPEEPLRMHTGLVRWDRRARDGRLPTNEGGLFSPGVGVWMAGWPRTIPLLRGVWFFGQLPFICGTARGRRRENRCQKTSRRRRSRRKERTFLLCGVVGAQLNG